MELASELDKAISELSMSLQRVQVTEGFKEVLSEAQLDEVYCAALCLSASVTVYLAKAIGYLESHFGKVASNVLISVKNLFGGTDFTDAKQSIDSAVRRYSESMGFLTATMTAELLLHDMSDRREKILSWLWKGDYWKRHEQLRDQRVASTGVWFLESENFKSWTLGGESPVLICQGMRMGPP